MTKLKSKTSYQMRRNLSRIKKLDPRHLIDYLPLLRKKPDTYKLSQTAGTAPGTLVYTGKNTEEKPEITLYRYDEEQLEEFQSETLGDILAKMEPEKANWINISALHNIPLIQEVGDHFDLHPLVMEDILNTVLSPQYEDYDDYLFITLKMMCVDPKHQSIEQEHVSFILGKNYLISFQERKKDVFEPVRQRLEAHKGRIRKRGIDYLLYALIDVIVDNYYTITEEYGDQLSELENELIYNPQESAIEQITHYKRQLIELRKNIYPLREALMTLTSQATLVKQQTIRFLGDVSSHIDHVINTMEHQRETLTSFMDLYMTNLSNKMNNVMKTLTIIATIFIPLTFVAGIYGMNFDNMPELHYKWGYPIALGSMLVTGLVMYVYMRNRDWF